MTNLSLATVAVLLVTAACRNDPTSSTSTPPGPVVPKTASARFSQGSCMLAVQVPSTWTRICGSVRVSASRRRTDGMAPEFDVYVERFSRGTGPTAVRLVGNERVARGSGAREHG